MTGKDVATVLYAKGALEKTFNKVAPSAENHYCQSKSYPLKNGELKVVDSVGLCKIPCKYRGSDDKHSASYATFPTLARTDARKQLVLTKQ